MENIYQEKQRIIQEFVPGKQVTMAHIIANPNPDIYKKLGVIGEHFGALGILTITPSEGAIIGADTATKAANVEVIKIVAFPRFIRSISLNANESMNIDIVKPIPAIIPKAPICFHLTP